MAINPDELRAWTAANLRARLAYLRDPVGTRSVTCVCGHRTEHHSGLCRRCRR